MKIQNKGKRKAMSTIMKKTMKTKGKTIKHIGKANVKHRKSNEHQRKKQ